LFDYTKKELSNVSQIKMRLINIIENDWCDFFM